jgi:two-component system phosphate regulon sensor histidine kinase PhoR
VKYTPADGWVKVRAEMRDTMVRITIQDNGLGISPEDQVHIFDRFYRVRRPETDSIEGTGLGLAIVKSLVEAHNGQIGLESRLGEGTTFYLLLPVHLQENPELPSPA